MNKEIVSKDKAVSLIKDTVIKLCDYVSFTLGPKGRNAIIDTEYTEPFITNDGVTIAKNLELSPREEVIAKIIKEASIKTCEKVGDGTTTSLVLLKSIYLESLNYLNKGISPFLIKEELGKSVKYVCDEIVKQSKKASDRELLNIAAVSSGDKEVGMLMDRCFKAIGKKGKIIVEESANESNKLEIINGMFLENGVVSSFLIKDRLKEEVIENPYILVADYKINELKQLDNILSDLKGRKLLIIAESFDEEVTEYLSTLKKNNIINTICIESPNYSENKTDILEDICIFTNSKLISPKYGNSLDEVSIEDLGTCKKIKVSRNNSIIYNDYSEESNERVKYIEKILSKEESEFEKEILENRIANLSGGIALIYAGAKTKSEMILNKMRIEDAIFATKTASKRGYSLGGGLTYYNISNTVDKKTIGNEILKESLKMPIKQIIINAGIDPNIVLKELKNKKETVGFDALNNKFVDMESCGIIDATDVLVEALKNAASIAEILLTTSLIVISLNKKEEKNITEVL